MLGDMASGSGRAAGPRGAKAGAPKTRSARSASSKARSGTGSRSASTSRSGTGSRSATSSRSGAEPRSETSSRAGTGSRSGTGARVAGSGGKGRSSSGRGDYVARPSSARSTSSASRGAPGAARSSFRGDNPGGDEGRPRRSSAPGASAAGGARGRSGARDGAGAGAWARPAASGASRSGGRGFGSAARTSGSSERFGSDRPRSSDGFRGDAGGASRAPARGPARDSAGRWASSEDRPSSRQGTGGPPSRSRSNTGAPRPPARTYGGRTDRPTRGTGGGGTYGGGTYSAEGRAPRREGTGARSDRPSFSDPSTGGGPRWGRPVASGGRPGAPGRSDGPRTTQPRSFDGPPRSFDRASRLSDDRAGRGPAERAPRGFQTGASRALSFPKRIDSRGAPAGRAAWDRDAPRTVGPRRETGAPRRDAGATRRETGVPRPPGETGGFRRETGGPRSGGPRSGTSDARGGSGYSRSRATGDGNGPPRSFGTDRPPRPASAAPRSFGTDRTDRTDRPDRPDRPASANPRRPTPPGWGSVARHGIGELDNEEPTASEIWSGVRASAEPTRGRAPGGTRAGGTSRGKAGRGDVGRTWADRAAAASKPSRQVPARRTPVARPRPAVTPLTGPLSAEQELEGQASHENSGRDDWSMTIVERVPAVTRPTKTPSRRAQPLGRRAEPAARPSARANGRANAVATPATRERSVTRRPSARTGSLLALDKEAPEALVTAKLADATRAYSADRYNDALRMLRKLSSQAPTSSPVKELLGLTLYRLGKWPLALRELEAHHQLSGSYDQFPVIADCYRALRRYDEADATWTELRQASPSPEVVAEGRLVAAGTLADRGDLRGAVKLLEGSLRRSKPKGFHVRQWYALADLYERAGELPRARDLFAQIVAADPDAYDVRQRLIALD
jgi:hypothetical protein